MTHVPRKVRRRQSRLRAPFASLNIIIAPEQSRTQVAKFGIGEPARPSCETPRPRHPKSRSRAWTRRSVGWLGPAFCIGYLRGFPKSQLCAHGRATREVRPMFTWRVRDQSGVSCVKLPAAVAFPTDDRLIQRIEEARRAQIGRASCRERG